MPLAVTLPLHFDLGLRTRRRRLRRFLFGALALAVAALLAAALRLPARAALGSDTAEPRARGVSTVIDHRDAPFALADLAIGDTFTLRRHDGVARTYEVIALDVVDSDRVEIEPDADGRTVALATPWPFDGTPVGGRWHYIVTGRLRL
jgi:sortase A